MNEYIKTRNEYLPRKVKIIFVLESPPTNGKYFYNKDGKSSEILFRSLMQSLFGKNFETKNEGLKKFENSGFILVNPIYEPVDKLDDRLADKLILNNYSNFKDDLESLDSEKKSKIILIKKNVCLLLRDKLLRDGFKVANGQTIIPFPMHYYYQKFDKLLQLALKG